MNYVSKTGVYITNNKEKKNKYGLTELTDILHSVPFPKYITNL